MEYYENTELTKDIIINSEKVIDKKHCTTKLLKTNKGRLILKKAPERSNKFIKYPSDINFEIEQNTYIELENRLFKKFNYPNIIENKKDTYILMDYIPGKIGFKNCNVNNVLESLIEFQTSGIYFYSSLYQKLIWQLSRGIFFQIFRWLLINIPDKYSFKLSIKCMYVLFKEQLNQKKLAKPLIIHNDLFGPNNIITLNDKIYYLDFESTVIEKRWCLIDIVDLCIREDSTEFNTLLLSQYLSKLSQKGTTFNEDDLLRQIRVGLLRRSLAILISTDKLKASTLWKNFIEDVLVNDVKYKEWFDTKVSNVLTC